MFAKDERLSRVSFCLASATCGLWVLLLALFRSGDPSAPNDLPLMLLIASPFVLAGLAASGIGFAVAGAHRGESGGAVATGMIASGFMLLVSLGLGASLFLMGIA